MLDRSLEIRRERGANLLSNMEAVVEGDMTFDWFMGICNSLGADGSFAGMFADIGCYLASKGVSLEEVGRTASRIQEVRIPRDVPFVREALALAFLKGECEKLGCDFESEIRKAAAIVGEEVAEVDDSQRAP